MTLQVTLTVSNRVAENARRIAEQSRRPLETVLAEWLDRVAAELPVEAVSDLDVLALCELQLHPSDQSELSGLLADNREGKLKAEGKARLDQLMQEYDRRLLRKAQGLHEAVKRGLRKPQAA